MSHPWERSYPEGARWDVPVETGTLTGLLDRSIASYSDRPAMEFRERQITYRELGSFVDRAASALRQLGIQKGDRVALFVPNTPWHPVFFFGVLRAGGWVVHLSPLDPPRVLARKLSDSGARLLVTTNLEPLLPHARRLLDEGAAGQVLVGEDALWGKFAGALPIPDQTGVVSFSKFPAGPPREWPPVSPDDVALLQYTGGTTGVPRAAMLTHANLTAALSIANQWAVMLGRPPRPDDRILGVLPLFHIFALMSVLLRPLANGAEILLRQRFDVETTLRDISEKRATSFAAVPTMWIALANHPTTKTTDFSSLGSTVSGGAPLPAEIAQRFHTLTGLRLGEGWGMTETAPVGTSLVPGGNYKPGAIGVPMPRVELEIVALEDSRRVLPSGEVGEIRVRGPNVFKGYWNRPEETKKAFVDGWFMTGDLGYMDEDGIFYIVDRKKDMIISGGFNVYPRVIEDAIYEHPDVAEAAVIGIPDPYRGQAAKAFIVLKPVAKPITLDSLREFLKDKLGRHELPTALEIREELPHTAVGKLWRKELADQEARNLQEA
ncbi:MAG: dicarboxylate--CoA ligase PimA [Acetobacteraceae bacterium]|nr:dicarboxylate--CoA ligase PimA [Acetobacteraceae bacterium]MBV8524800.1 dicarboxylate--CoA ligase PimA [Acetobacteraceae bacterium]